MAADNVVVLTSSVDTSLSDEERAQDTGTSSEEYVEEDSDELLLELEHDSDVIEMSDECPLPIEDVLVAAAHGNRRGDRESCSPYSYTNRLHKVTKHAHPCVHALQCFVI